jgi:hypothetical protein
MVQREVSAAGTTRAGEHPLEIHRALDSTDHREPGAGGAGSAALHDKALDGQALAALGAARGDDGAAAARLHAHEEAVSAGAAGLGGLVGTLHGEPLLESLFEPGTAVGAWLKKRTATPSLVRENP